MNRVTKGAIKTAALLPLAATAWAGQIQPLPNPGAGGLSAADAAAIFGSARAASDVDAMTREQMLSTEGGVAPILVAAAAGAVVGGGSFLAGYYFARYLERN